ncbi:MAG: DUF397 domain-containing protein [Nocardiopsaceae bacterium]|nr:DUF397 domain-containing protein [Nocardiopsaceae bacterium]
MSTDSPARGAESRGGEGGSAAAAASAEGGGPIWHKSSYSNSPPECVEVTRLSDASVLVRDSGRPNGTVLCLSGRAWREFIAAVSRGDLE